ncbi:Junctional adhesion molecule-like [Anabarilius grahami]|uniref:Junctional adhesion molecule-like n=1 Tax=Anabarilius grahami TaxID=495550 RepID=A0A3N0Y0Q6_ANAGA|nr:Junctional adhesion molecule-like [Anabarilius grahami]
MKRRVMAVLQTSDVMCLCVFLLCAGLHFTAESVNAEEVMKRRVMAVLQTSDVMCLCVFLLCAGLHFTAGCSLSGNEASVSISRYSGESVFLSCLVKCSGNHKPDKIRWKLPNNREINQTTNSGELNRLYQGRFQMFGKNTGNFSLLISNLTEKYEGLYSCWINESQHKSFNLTIKGCVLSKHPNNIISYPGESVTLPCSCEDPKTKPKHVEWKRAALNETLVSDSKDVSGRFQILRDSPHNLSLRISNLTEADGGLYVCTVNGKQSRSINLTVTAKKGRRGTLVTQRPDPQDDVTSSSVVCSKSHKPRSLQMNTEEAVYASVQKHQT